MKDTVTPRLFGLVVRQMRVRAGFSQEEFAVHCGLHRTYIGAIERGEKSITLVTASRIARALETPLSVLIERMEQLQFSENQKNEF